MFQLMRNCGLGLCLILIGCSGEGDLPALEGPDVVHGTEPTHCQAHTQFGTPTQQSDIVLCREGYVLGYSYSNKHAVFAQYHATLSSVSPKIERVTEYIVDDDILPLYQSTSDDYKYTGYDRGHLAPYASMDFSQLSADESNLMSNIIPMTPSLNRGIWATMENLIRSSTSESDVHVSIGPMPQSTIDNLNGVSVPGAFFSILYYVDIGEADAFIFYNETPATYEQTTIDAIEAVTGYDFLYLLEDQLENMIEAQIFD